MIRLTSRHSQLFFVAMAVALAIITCVALAHRVIAVAGPGLVAPYDQALERPTVDDVDLIAKGINIYSLYDRMPFDFTIYTPLYFLLVAALPASPNPYLVPRLVSAFFMLGSAALVFRFAGRLQETILASLSFVIFIFLVPVNTNLFFARMDPMALFFSVLSISLIAVKRPKARSDALNFVAAAAAFVAVWSKQSYIAAPITGFVYNWLIDRKRAWDFLATFLLMCSGAFLIAQAMWGKDFWYSVLFLASGRPHLHNYVELPSAFFSQFIAVFVFASAALLWLRWILRVREGVESAANVWALYLVTSVAVVAFELGKEGAGTNYLFEPTLAALLFLQASFHEGQLHNFVSDHRKFVCLLMVVGGLAFLDLARLPAISYRFASFAGNAEAEHSLLRIKAELRDVGGRPNGQWILWHPWIRDDALSLGYKLTLNDGPDYRSYWLGGKISTTGLERAIIDKKFDVIVEPLDEKLSREGFTHWTGKPRLADLIDDHYHVALKGTYAYLIPND
jgi:hypothetical protein